MTISEMVTRITSIERPEEELKNVRSCAVTPPPFNCKERGWFRGRK
jgi:hypothetical protein